MKRIIFLFTMLLAFYGLSAQKTQFEIQHFDEKKTGPVSIYSGSRLLGETDSFGRLQLNSKAWFIQIRLEQNHIPLSYEVIDTSLIVEKEQGKIYKLRIIPETTESAVVRATRAGENEPHTKSTISAKEIAQQNTGRDLPILLQNQPSVITTSDAGNGVGYTGIRVRGSDASRTNITLNGVPINDAESQSTFWVNMPDLASSVQNIQLQRGIGSSTNGAGAFGASLNIQTHSSFKPYGQLSQSFGSFNTRKTSVATGTGLIANHWTLDLRLSQIHSDGFIERAVSDLNSWFVSGGYFARKWSVKLLAFSGKEVSFQAWSGIPREKLYGNDSALKAHYSRNDIRNGGLTYRNVSDSLNLFNSGKRTFNYYNYDNETDNYQQSHFHLYLNHRMNAKNVFNLTLYKTLGNGYFEQYRPMDPVSRYGLAPLILGNDTMSTSDLIRRRWLDNTLTGLNADWQYKTRNLHVISGGGYNQYFGNHFGELVWAQLAPGARYLSKYYNATGDKFDGNVFTKWNWKINNGLHVTTDLQIRRVYHTGRGMDNDRRPIRFKGNYLFFNPKFGINKDFRNGVIMYTSVNLAGKEPARSDYTDHGSGYIPKAEKMLDYEFGAIKKWKKLMGTLNIYFMDYNNQLVLTGAVNDVGTPLRTNVESSYRAGIELTSEYNLSDKFSLTGNVTLSKNNIAKIEIKTLDYADFSEQTKVLEDVPLSYSPAVIAAMGLQYQWKKWSVFWNHKYVGKQYLDNTGDEDKMLKAYYFSEIWVNKSVAIGNGSLELKFQILNVFNALYNNNGYAFEYLYGANNLTREVYYFPSAPRNFMCSAALKF